MKHSIETDIAIIGGGIAGLWILNRVRQAGFSAVLLECDMLGSSQTSKAQGIIHGGMKYALQGSVTQSTRAIADMPTRWKKCLAGTGEIDLSKVPILSSQQYLWSTKSLASKLSSMLAGITLKSGTETLSKDQFPEIFRNAHFKGQVIALDEVVLDVHALLFALMKSHQDVIFKIDRDQDVVLDANDHLASFRVQSKPMKPLEVKAQKYIFTSGVGNALILKKFCLTSLEMQRRPLHMVIVKHEISTPLYGHCLGLSQVPRMTITTHRAQDGKYIWYLGGQIAETGVKRDKNTQIEMAKNELNDIFPWLDFSKAQYASFMIDRAENKEPLGARPSSCFVKEVGNIMIAWPTKLAFAPKLADQVMDLLQNAKIKPNLCDTRPCSGWPMPAVASPPWEQLF